MAHFTGKDLYGSFGGTVLVGLRVVDMPEMIDKAEVTHAGDSDKTYVQTYRDATFSLTFVLEDASGTTTQRALAVGTSGELIIGPQGTAAGKPKYAATAFVEKNGRPVDYAKEVVWTVDLQRNSAWVDNYMVSGDVFP